MAPFFSIEGRIYEVITVRNDLVIAENVANKTIQTFTQVYVDKNAKFGTIAYAMVEPGTGNYILSEMEPDEKALWRRVAVVEI
jgi:hypothetical protein